MELNYMENENQNKINENNLESISDFNIAFGPDNSVSNTEEEIEVLPDFNNTNLSNPSIVPGTVKLLRYVLFILSLSSPFLIKVIT